MKIQFLGHSCFWVETKEKKILFDPFISANPLAQHIDIKNIKADYIVITHAHQDHILDVEAIAKNCNSHLIANYEVVSWFQAKGLNGTGMNTGGEANFDFGTLKLTNALHSSSFPDGSYGGNPNGVVIWNDEICFHHAGDTALSMDMKLIPMTCPKLDFAILPIGGHFTMNHSDALLASEFLNVETVIACHFDTFDPIKINHREAEDTFAKGGKKLILPSIGDFIQW